MKNENRKTKPDRVLSMLGIAAKAGKVVSGEFATENAVKAGKAFLVITAEDASGNTTKKFRDMTDYYHVPLLAYGTKETLGGCIGKDYRSSLAVVDEKLAEAIQKKKHEVEALTAETMRI
ncbi:MAG: ribosomal L7Ae/L30e/S12e/Gadd45 family protein [Lachnospiraceae bacterium]|nr:ribosomal L7Ae/L30e/S12e/Gadd45 family protein [bacterium]MDY5518361.1 ribosomal L7Ae/L30e/S12e/Gadd45 family protein [Lachnospiraceae bacterium]